MEDTGTVSNKHMTKISEACSAMNKKYRGQFIPDEENSRIKVRMPYYSATVRVSPYTFKDVIIKALRRCVKINEQRTEQERIKKQNKLF